MSLKTIIDDFRNGVAAEGPIGKVLGSPYSYAVAGVIFFACVYHDDISSGIASLKSHFMVQEEQGQIEIQVAPSSFESLQPKIVQ